jgi:hypothetical protein
MAARGRFDAEVITAMQRSKILGIKAGTQPHRFIGLWMVVVEGRVFVRSWSMKPDGWHAAFLKDSHGVVQIADREIPIRAVHTRSERLKDAVDRAYREKYHTPGAVQYVRDLCRAKSRATTTELVPVD